eukprot:TRINITY_DN4002_c0_g3_i1.p1 TRINITY_DN4002_c0_g3~~TRINITY_DN4002_c0_g3_i1.p1  ORF type:complete len:345 (+),score=64.62 TRINITY_DN4002_c0_g3_i1:1131-2165(+)
MVALPIPQRLLKRIKEAEAVIMNETAQTDSAEAKKIVVEEIMEKKEATQPAKSPIQAITEDKINAKDIDNNPAHKTPEKNESTEKSSLQPLKMKESEVQQFLERYTSVVSSKLIQSYCPLSELLEKAHSGYEPHWLSLTNNSSIEGLAVFHLDPAGKSRARVTILHASTASEERLQSFLGELVSCIWENVNCEEIRVGLAHFSQADGKLGPYTPLKAAYQQLHFRWKTLTNDEQGNRILILGLTRPSPFLNPRRLDAKKEPITFKHAVVLSLGQSNNHEVENESEGMLPMGQCSYLSAFLGLKLAGHLQNMTAIKFGKESEFHSLSLTNALTQLEELVSYFIIA